MAEDEGDDELPSVDHGPLNEGPGEKIGTKSIDIESDNAQFDKV